MQHQPNEQADLVAIVDAAGEDLGAGIVDRLDAIAALLTEIRNDQRAVQRSTSDGKKATAAGLKVGVTIL